MTCRSAPITTSQTPFSRQNLGGWGVGGRRLNVRVATAPSRTFSAGAKCFDAFFHSNAAAPLTPAGVQDPALRAKLDINHACSEALRSLPGIGSVLAARIIAGRPFKSADELERVPRIGDKKYECLRPYFR